MRTRLKERLGGIGERVWLSRRLEGRCLPCAGWPLGSAVGYEAVAPRPCPAKLKNIAESTSRAAGTGISFDPARRGYATSGTARARMSACPSRAAPLSWRNLSGTRARKGGRARGADPDERAAEAGQGNRCGRGPGLRPWPHRGRNGRQIGNTRAGSPQEPRVVTVVAPKTDVMVDGSLSGSRLG